MFVHGFKLARLSGFTFSGLDEERQALYVDHGFLDIVTRLLLLPAKTFLVSYKQNLSTR